MVHGGGAEGGVCGSVVVGGGGVGVTSPGGSPSVIGASRAQARARISIEPP